MSTNSGFTIKNLIGDVDERDSSEVTCTYFVSVHNKNQFFEVDCINKKLCHGFCKEDVTIIGLESNLLYDIKIRAHKEYRETIYFRKKTCI